MPSKLVMGKFKRGMLHSGSKMGPVVKNPKQAVAIMLSEQKNEDDSGTPATPVRGKKPTRRR